MKIKVIDLLNKIANREELPNKIKYQFKTFELNFDGIYVRTDKVYEHEYGFKTLLEYVFTCDLNDEVEILEEDKKIPEKLPKWATTREDKEYTNQEEHTLVVSQKINEIIDYLKSKGE